MSSDGIHVSNNYVAVVKQPDCYNVFLIDSRGEKCRLKQSTGAECVAFAEGYVGGAETYSDFAAEVKLEIKYFQCGEGDAAVMEWRSAL